jgi:periplasmic protein TonB
MIAKKNKKYNLERKRFAFFQIGLLLSGSLCLAAFEWSTAVPDEYVATLEDENSGPIWADPITEKEIIIIEKKPKTTKLINMNNLDKIKIVKKKTVEGKVKTTFNNDIISMDGDENPFGDINMTISDPSEPIVDVPDVEPQFVGGETAMYQWIIKNMEYPPMAIEMGIQGLVYVQFVVNKSGSISSINTVKSPHKLLTKEAQRMVKKMPKWIPGEQAGKKVRVRFTLPINFKLK